MTWFLCTAIFGYTPFVIVVGMENVDPFYLMKLMLLLSGQLSRPNLRLHFWMIRGWICPLNAGLAHELVKKVKIEERKYIYMLNEFCVI